ncbi:hypothetical protein [uncultured Friedmanniella sp.]|uniref:hypothetical protein n=1 Tax=uncultured Friedmanniella sp. TaxID=335381 RepID=UPI0035CB619D
MSETPRQLPFKWYRSSDIDGSPHLIVDAAVADLSEWRVEITDRFGNQTLKPFELSTADRRPDGSMSLNPYVFSSEMVPAWLLCLELDVGSIISPDGTRYL